MYTFFDVETPNKCQNKICSIGIIQTDDDGFELFHQGFLVDPECVFDGQNIGVHGITRKQCTDQPTFPVLWNSTLHDLFNNTCVVAHNASFDLSILSKTLQHYGIDTPQIQYVCTLEISKSLVPNLESYKLNEICSALDLPEFTHHDALSDTEACSKIFWTAKNSGYNVVPKNYIPCKKDTLHTRSKDEMQFITKAATELYGIVIGISIDGNITPIEHEILNNWCDEYANMDYSELKEMASKIKDILADDFVTEDERSNLLSATRPFIESEIYVPATVAFQELKGILKGIRADGLLSDMEASGLHDWIINHEEFSNDSTTAPLINLIESALTDGLISEKEQEDIFTEFHKIIDPVEDQKTEIEFENRIFCLSGNFVYGSKKKVEDYIIEKGGSIASSVSKKVSYVVVGGCGSDQYSFDNYGSKVKRALDLKQNGADISVISEDELFDR